MEWKLRKGIGEFIFGMKRDEVTKALGTAPETEIDDDDQIIIDHYPKHHLNFSFDQGENDRLTIIQAWDVLTLGGQNTIGLEVDAFLELLFQNGVSSDWELDEYDDFVVHYHEDEGIEIHCEEGVVALVEINVPFDEEDDYDWPA
ncbi:MAG: hypothetical protein AAF193_10765 [Bacteroidota bacterium]